MTPAGLDYVAKTCLGKDPDDRWQTARDLLRELKRVEAGGATPAESAETVRPQRLARWQRPIPALLAGATFQLGAGQGLSRSMPSQSAQSSPAESPRVSPIANLPHIVIPPCPSHIQDAACRPCPDRLFGRR